MKKQEEITNKTMTELLFELSNSKFWPIIQEYNKIRIKVAQETLNAIDVFEKPTLAARAQGLMNGLRDLEECVKMIIEKKQQDSEDNKEDKE